MDGVNTPAPAAPEAQAPPAAPATPETPATPAAPAEQPAAAPAAAPASEVPAAPEKAHWAESLPEAWREHAKGMASPEEALEAMKRGMAYKPAKSVDDVKITMPEGIEADELTSNAFKKLVVDEGLTAAQAQKLSDWYTDMQITQEQAVIEQGLAALKTRWGVNEEANRHKALTFFTALDRKMEGRLSSGMGGRQLANSPDAVEALYHMAQMVSEDTVGSAQGTTGDTKAMSAEDFYGGLFKGKA